jgi:hypothetical protein
LFSTIFANEYLERRLNVGSGKRSQAGVDVAEVPEIDN